MVRKGSAVWQGGIKDGSGTVSSESGVLNGVQYNFVGRFESDGATNPEELIGAAHAACFSMALSGILGGASLTADKIETSAAVTIEKVEGGFAITKVHLTVNAVVPGATAEQFAELAATAKAGCPVSKLFNAEITMDATLAN